MSERKKACEIDGHMVYAVRCDYKIFNFQNMKEEYEDYEGLCWKLTYKNPIEKTESDSLAREMCKGDICLIYFENLPNKSKNGFLLYSNVKEVKNTPRKEINKHSKETDKKTEQILATLYLDNFKLIPDVNLRFREDNIETEYEYSLPRRSVQHIYDNPDDKEQKVQRMVNDIYRVVNEDNIFDKLADMFGQN